MASLVFLCNNCEEPIRTPQDGVLVRGNIYVADAHDRGGLVGNAFPDPADGKIRASEIKEFAFCQQCFEALLPWNKQAMAQCKVKTKE